MGRSNFLVEVEERYCGSRKCTMNAKSRKRQMMKRMSHHEGRIGGEISPDISSREDFDQERAQADGKIVLKYKDFPDTVRYLVCSGFGPPKIEKPKTHTQEYLEN